MTRRRVLVVDNEAPIREMLAIILESELGHIVDQAADGGEALTASAKAPPDLIMLDMKMPGIDGFEFAELYKATSGKKAPIVVITAAQSAASAAEEIGACGYLAKPFGIEPLLAAVEKCMGQG